MHGRPPGQRDRQAEQPADGEEHDGRDGVGLDQRLRAEVDLEAGGRAGPELGLVHDVLRHRSTTKILPSIVWCPSPQNSLQTIVYSPDAFGVTVSTCS